MGLGYDRIRTISWVYISTFFLGGKTKVRIGMLVCPSSTNMYRIPLLEKNAKFSMVPSFEDTKIKPTLSHLHHS